MKLHEITTKLPGTYAAVLFDETTMDSIIAFIKHHNIPNGLTRNDLHSTVCYSRKPVKVDISGVTATMPWPGTPHKVRIFKSDDNPTALVVEYKCPAQEQEFKKLRARGATWDYDNDYTPHFTLSYDIGDYNWHELKDSLDHFDGISIIDYYTESLQPDKVYGDE